MQNKSHGSNRKYSLLSASSIFLTKRSNCTNDRDPDYQSRDPDEDKHAKMSNLLNRRNTSSELPLNLICQRCKRYEIDLAAASNNLNATDAELKASRQVINLLQRQLELFQVEKEGLEKLIVSQSQGPSFFDSLRPNAQPSHSNDSSINVEALKISEETLKNIDNCSPDDIQKKLLTLIKTQLYAKDEEIVRLKSSLKEAQNEREQVNVQLHMLEDDVCRLNNENILLKQNLTLRDQTIESLSAEVFEQSRNECLGHQTTASSESSSSNIDAKSIHERMDKLSETLETYKKTNRMLSAKVIKLTDRCHLAEKREMETRSQCQELEAKCCQIQSKLLSLLKEIEQSSKQVNISHDGSDTGQHQKLERVEVIQSESVKLLIKRLLEDKSLDIPLSWKEGNKTRWKGEKNDPSKVSECDELGFYIVKSDGCSNYNAVETSPGSGRSAITSPAKSRHKGLRRGFSEAASFNVFSSSNLEAVGEESTDINELKPDFQNPQSVDASKGNEVNWRLKWDEFIVDFDNIELAKSKEFKRLLRTGVPQEYRCKVWKILIDLKVGKDRKQYGPDYYQSLLEPRNKSSGHTQTTIQNSPCKQIELDLMRTLPNNKYFETLESTGTVRLRRVLTAFSHHKPQIGYCQGMNRLAAVALLVLPEEEAFWCLVAIVEKIMPTGYYNDLWLAQVDSNVVMDFVAIKMPQLSNHFKKHQIELSLFAWFLTIFVDGTPPALFLRLWDCFLYEGDKIMFRVALALLKKHEEELININNSVSVNNFIRSTVNTPMDIDQFFEIAFESINPLPGRMLRHKREQHFNLMKSNLENISHQNPSRNDSTDESRNVMNQGYKGAEENSVCQDSSIISI